LPVKLWLGDGVATADGDGAAAGGLSFLPDLAFAPDRAALAAGDVSLVWLGVAERVVRSALASELRLRLASVSS
jgi:hypothetical protein